jgi:hypothetical protein
MQRVDLLKQGHLIELYTTDFAQTSKAKLMLRRIGAIDQ